MSSTWTSGSTTASPRLIFLEYSYLQINLEHSGVPLDLRRRSLGQDLAVMEDGDPLRQFHDDLHVVLDDQDRQVLRYAAHQFHRVMRLGRAHPRRRLVQTEEPWFCSQCYANLEVALLAMRQVGRHHLGLAAQANRLQHCLG